MPKHSLFIVRHGERLDEVDEDQWRREIAADTTGRDKHHLAQDPPLTAYGTHMASDAVKSLRAIAPGVRFTGIYCSRMRRCIQTAIPFALEYDVPIVLSKDLSLSAIGVYKAMSTRGHYDFCSMEDIKAFSPSEVRYVELPLTLSSHGKSADWRQSVYNLAAENETALIVAHRETIRDFLRSPARIKIPYCSIGKFEYSRLSPNTLRLVKLVDRHGADVGH